MWLFQVAPAIRVAIGEEFGMEAGSISTGKLVSALRTIGFDKVLTRVLPPILQ